MQIPRIGGAPPARPATRAGTVGAHSAFAGLVGGEAPAASAEVAASSDLEPPLLTPGAGVQADAQLRDRAAQRHGNSMLQALSTLQLALLGGAPRTPTPDLADLAANCPDADEPGLQSVLRAIAVRAAVELERTRGTPAN